MKPAKGAVRCVRMRNKTFTFSLIIPVYRPNRRFVEMMRRVAAQHLLPEQILIVETVSGEGKQFMQEALAAVGQACGVADHMTEGAGGRPFVRYMQVEKKDFDHGGTRDMAARLCDTDLMIFMTMDALPANRHLFEKLTVPFEDPQVACCYARQLPDRDAARSEIFTRQFNYPENSIKKTKDDLGALGIKTFFCSNVCAAYRRQTYLELGGFEKRTIFNEDMIFAGKAVQAGYAVYYQAQAKVVHSHNYTGRMQLARNFDLGVSQAQHPEIFADIRSDSEGIRLVKETMRYLAASGQTRKIPGLIWISGCKYLGYRLGKGYTRLPAAVIRAITLNRAYWEQEEAVEERKTKTYG